MKTNNTSVQAKSEPASSYTANPARNDFNIDDYDDSESDGRLHYESSNSDDNFKIQIPAIILEWE